MSEASWLRQLEQMELAQAKRWSEQTAREEKRWRKETNMVKAMRISRIEYRVQEEEEKQLLHMLVLSANEERKRCTRAALDERLLDEKLGVDWFWQNALCPPRRYMAQAIGHTP